ncbi:MAG: LysR family transcriptional regulator [Minicystis sp.]
MKRIDPPKPRLDVRDLEVVLALASAGSTASAAAALHLTQSAVSRALCLAEDKIGARLFDRAPRGLSPTAAGERLIAGAAPLLAQLVELEREVTERPGPARITIVCECYTAYRWLPSALANLRRRLPSLQIDLAVEHTSDPVEALRAGTVDVALLTTAAVPRASGIEERSLFSDEIVFVVSTAHPLARRAHVTAADLTAHPLLTSNTPEGERRWFLGAVFGRRRPDLSYVKFPLTEAIIDAARAGMGVAVLSEWIASGYLGGEDLVAKRFAKGPLRRPWRIAYRSEAGEAAARLAGALESGAPKLYRS